MQYFSNLFKSFLYHLQTFDPCLYTSCICCVVQSLSLSDSVTPWTAARQASLSSTISWSLLKFMSVESVMATNHLILCHTLLLSPSVFPSIRVFSNESVVHIKRPEYWSFSIIPSSEYFLYTYFIFISGIINIIFKGNLK